MGMQNTRTTLICRMEMGGMERIRAATLTNLIPKRLIAVFWVMTHQENGNNSKEVLHTLSYVSFIPGISMKSI